MSQPGVLSSYHDCQSTYDTNGNGCRVGFVFIFYYAMDLAGCTISYLSGLVMSLCAGALFSNSESAGNGVALLVKEKYGPSRRQLGLTLLEWKSAGHRVQQRHFLGVNPMGATMMNNLSTWLLGRALGMKCWSCCGRTKNTGPTVQVLLWQPELPTLIRA